ncbi:MAG TPA: penicillin-binding protein 2 [candidate division Zixibacteria bacterium]|nr:penicillin-binding protein 2 [candidate division Zixibacteria bacterium]
MAQSTLSIQAREKLALAFVGVLLLVLIIGLLKLQVVDHGELLAQSEQNRIRVQPLVPRRGVVLDREHRIVIDNRPSYTLCIVAAEMDQAVTIPSVARLLGLDEEQVERRLRKNLVSRYQPAPIKRDVSFDIVAVVEEQADRFPGVMMQMEEVRRYTTELGAECISGYVGEVSQEEIRREDGANYRLGSVIGKKGLEKEYDSLLRGHEGTAYIEVTATGQTLGPYSGKLPIPAEAGADLTISIDIDLQRTCVEVLDTFCCGAVVAMDPRTGEILAMTSYPSYDANIFSSVIPESLWTEITRDSTHPLLNRPLDGLYPPGSTTKLVAIGAGLEEGLIGEHTLLRPCTGGYRFGNRVFHCWDLSGHGQLDGLGAIEQSCDVYLYQVGLKLGVDNLGRYLSACGFGRPTHIDLPSEAVGLSPSEEYYNNRFGKNKWSQGVVLNLSIGQGEILATPLQLAQFYCGLANDGKVLCPHILKQIRYSDGRVERIAPKLSFELPFSKKTRDYLMEGIRRVVEGEHGTARRLRNKLYSIGGKTGTAENPHGENHSWFVGVAPLEKPEIVVCAIVENAGHGSEIAAPVVGKIIHSYMEKKMADDGIAGLAGKK